MYRKLIVLFALLSMELNSMGHTSSDLGCELVCGNNDLSGEWRANEGIDLLDDYDCSSHGIETYYEWIDWVACHNISSFTGDNGGYYWEPLAPSYVFSKEDVYHIEVKPGMNGVYQEFIRVWIDFNRNGTFDHPSEMIVDESVTSAHSVFKSFVIPSSAYSGNTHMRVSLKYGSAPMPCETFQYGEVEDYEILIQEAPLYCEQKGGLHHDLWIDKIDPGTGGSFETGDNGGYLDNTESILHYSPGDASLELIPGTAGDPEYTWWMVRIDYNRNFVFDRDDVVWYGKGIPPMKAIWEVLPDVKHGWYRMRISAKKDYYAYGCEIGFVGEVEDYTVFVENVPEEFELVREVGKERDEYTFPVVESGYEPIIFPNPVNETIHIVNTNFSKAFLIGAHGQIVLKVDLALGQNNIAVGNLNNGTYVLRMISESAESTQRIVVQNP